MTFPLPTLYRDPMLSLGHIYDTTQQDVRSEVTPVALNYGQAVAWVNGKIAVAGATDKLYGIVRANEVLKNTFAFEGEAEQAGSYEIGEVVPIMVHGTMVVATTGPVSKGQTAILAANGLFAAATDTTTVGIGTFMSDGTDSAAVSINL
jgi:hypothetical protein